MNRAEYITAVVNAGVEARIMHPDEAILILSRVALYASGERFGDGGPMRQLHKEVFDRYDWIMHSKASWHKEWEVQNAVVRPDRGEVARSAAASPRARTGNLRSRQ